MHVAVLALAALMAMHSRSEGRAKLALDETGRMTAKITLSTLDLPELCDIDLSASDPAVREERLGRVDACFEREVPLFMRVHADDATPCRVVVTSSEVTKQQVVINAVASCPAFPDDKLTVDWGLFHSNPIDHVTVTTFEQPHDKPKLVMLSKRSPKLVVEVAHSLWPALAAAGAAVLVIIGITIALLVRRRRARATAAVVVALLCASGAHAEEPAPPKFRVDQRVLVREQHRADAEVCLIHLHGNEVNARAVMREMSKTSCANAVWLDDARYPPDSDTPWGDDRIPAPNATMEAQKCTVNPNRILTPRAFAHRIANDCEDDSVARRELRAFLDVTLLPALRRCRTGANGALLPVVTFHNNSNLTPRDMDTRMSTTTKGRESDILFVTQRADYDALVALKEFTVALQNNPPADDGSLSVLYAKDRYINVESQIAPDNLAVNRAMAIAALRVFGALKCGDDVAEASR